VLRVWPERLFEFHRNIARRSGPLPSIASTGPHRADTGTREARLSGRAALERQEADMAKRTKSKALDTEFTMFDVVYEDGSRSSNRRVPTALLGGLDGDEPAREAILEQDRVISERSGKPPLAIATLRRSAKSAAEPAADEKKKRGSK
jgi:hypothetical protein